jgi:hypothetical protein
LIKTKPNRKWSPLMVTQFYINSHNFQSDSWIMLNFFYKLLKALFLVGLTFHCDQTSKRLSNKAQKFLYGLGFIY